MTVVGIDFGTSNSAVAIATGKKTARLVDFRGPDDGGEPLMRTLLYFEPGGEVTCGTEGITRYLANDSEGRLVQSIKSYLATSSFDRTQILGRSWTIVDLVARFLRGLRDRANEPLGNKAIVGRPVRYVGAEAPEDDARAIARMREALALAGFDEVEFVLEPVAAAARYASRNSSAQRVVIADFGGGTSDFSVLELGANGSTEVLSTSGVGVGGDSFDGAIVDQAVAPLLGKGSNYKDAFGKSTRVPSWIFHRLRRWHHLSFLKAPKTMALIEKVAHGSDDPEAIARLAAIIHDDRGFTLHQGVERSKIELSQSQFTLLSAALSTGLLESAISRGHFDEWIESDLERIATALCSALESADLEPKAVDRIFATGGSSHVPAVKNLLATICPRADIVGGDELTSVATGLALC